MSPISHALLFVAVLSRSRLLLCEGFPGISFVNIGGVIMNSNAESSSGYVINSYSSTKDGNCVQVITVSGKGIDDTFEVSCDKISGGVNTLTTNSTMMVGDPNSFCVFSDEPSTLVVIDGKKCTRRTYTTADGQTTVNFASPLTEDECSQVLQKIATAQEEAGKYWKDWSNSFQENMNDAFPPGFPFAGVKNPVNEQSENKQDWKDWSDNFEKTLSDTLNKAFPPGFPFYN